jgi:radical SAM protein with 4Fe4S-binding SPASM domain
MTEKSCEEVTGRKEAFISARKGINLLLDKKVPFVVKGVFLPPVKDELEKFEEWSSTIPWMDRRPDYSIFFDLRNRRDKKNDLIKKLRLPPGKIVDFLRRKKESYFKDMKQFCSKFIGPPGDRLFACGAGKGSGCVDSYGNFQLCISLRHTDTVYNLNKGTLKEALTDFFPVIRDMKATNPDYLVRCAVCFLKGLCEQCPGKSWLEYGNLDTPVEYLCDVAHEQARFLGLLQEGEKAWEIEDWRKRIDVFINSD